MTVLIKPNQSVIVVPPQTQARMVIGGTPTSVVVPQDVGPKGDPGPPGPGTFVVGVPNDEWPPVDPQPNTLYLRLAP